MIQLQAVEGQTNGVPWGCILDERVVALAVVSVVGVGATCAEEPDGRKDVGDSTGIGKLVELRGVGFEASIEPN